MEITTPDATTPCCSYSILEIQVNVDVRHGVLCMHT